MKNKKVIFIDFLDAIKVPSKAEKPTNATDFVVDCNFIKALKKASHIVRVNLLGGTGNMRVQEKDQMKMMAVISYEISLYADIAVSPYCEQGELHKAFEKAAKDTIEIEIFNDEGFWLMIGSWGSTDAFGIDTMNMEDFCDG